MSLVTGWFCVPYSPHPRRARARYVAIDDQTPEIFGCGGAWSESEIAGDRAVVRVRSTSAMLSNLSRRYRNLSETEARRLTPRLATLVHAVRAQAPSLEQRGLLARWRGVGFSLGWRLPEDVMSWAVKRGLEPDRYAAALSFGFTRYGRAWADLYEFLLFTKGRILAGGAFPTTSVLDTFNRTAENPLSQAGAWTNRIVLGDNDLRTDGTGCILGTAGGAFGSAFRAATFGPDSEAYWTVSTLPASTEVTEAWIRISGGGSSSPSGYFVDTAQAATDTWTLWKSVSGTQTQLGASASQNLAAGESQGCEAISTAIAGYRKSGGSWSQVLSRTDSAVSGSGNIGGVIQQTTAITDDFGGGTVVTGSSVTPSVSDTGTVAESVTMNLKLMPNINN